MKKQEEIKVVIVEPLKAPRIEIIENTLEAMQKIVGGWIEPLNIADGIDIICNEEGKMNGLTLNRGLRTEGGEIWEVIAGTFLIAGFDDDTGHQISLTDEQAEYYKKKFWEAEDFLLINGKILSVKSKPIEE